MSVLTEKIENLDAQQIVDALRELAEKFDDASTLVYETLLDALETKVPEEKFIKICEAL